MGGRQKHRTANGQQEHTNINSRWTLGKGFAVVAEEVRNLAQRCAEAARNTTDLIEGSVARAKEGTEVAETAGTVLRGIVTEVTQVAELLDGITWASAEQAQAVEQINTAVSQMDKVTQQNAAAAEESASVAEELSGQAQAVKGMVGELTVLVGGRTRQRDAEPQVEPTADAPKPSQPQRKAPRPPKSCPAAGPKASPREPTPTDVGDLQDF